MIFGGRLRKLKNPLFLFDALGLGLFTLIGFGKGLEHHLSPGICVALGTITGCFGGVLRDIMLNTQAYIYCFEWPRQSGEGVILIAPYFIHSGQHDA